MTARTARLAYGACLVALAVVFLVLVIPGFVLTRVWEDEAYNLSVPLDLVRGLGYSSSGALVGSVPTAFDYRISTGPVVLLPIALPLALGVDPVVAGRAVMALFAAGLALAAFAVGRRTGGPWGGLAAVAVVLAFNGAITPSPIQGLTDVLGEVPAAAFTLLAVLQLRARPWLAGLLLGAAIQCKNLAVLSVPAFLVVLVLMAGPRLATRVRTAAVFVGTVAVPTVVFEASKLIALGPAAYAISTRENYYFLRSGGQTGFHASPVDKLVTVFEPWGVPAVVAALAVVALVVLAIAELRAGDRTRAHSWLLAALLAVSWCGWWFVSTHQPVWIRHPSPGLLVVGAMAAGLGVGGWRALAARWRTRRPSARPVFLVAASAVLVAGLGVALGDRIVDLYRPVGESLTDQRVMAEVVDSLPGDRVRGDWGPMVSIALLADRPPVLAGDDRDTAGIWVLPTWRDIDDASLARAGAGRACGPGTARATAGYVYCTAAG